jgi:hypothetical protein
MADLGFSHSYFSCYKYLETDHVSITKVVVCFTTNPIKLSLQFSEFSTHFYAFYKFLQKGGSLLKIHLSTGSLDFLIPYNHTLTFSSQVPALLQSVHRGPRRRKGAHRWRGAAGPGQQASWGGGELT